MNRFKWNLFSLYLLTLGLRPGGLIETYELRVLAFPFEQIRQNGYLVSGLLLLVFPFLPTPEKWSFRPRDFSLGIILQITLNLYLSVRTYQTGAQIEWGHELLLALATAYVFVFEIPTWIRSLSDVEDAISSIAVAGTLWALVSLYQYLVSPGSAVWEGRFLGISGHPQFAGVFLAIGCSALLFSVRKSRPKWYHRALPAAAFLLCFSELVATGSRTALVAVMAGAAFLYLRPKLALIAVACGLAVLSVFVLSSQSSNDTGNRLMSTENTRQEAWTGMASDLIESPIVGVGANVQYSEGSLLRIGAVGGLIGLAMALAIIFGMIHNLYVASTLHGNDGFNAIRGLSAITICILAASVFEGILMEKFSFPITAYMLCIVAFNRSSQRPSAPSVRLPKGASGNRRRTPSAIA